MQRDTQLNQDDIKLLNRFLRKFSDSTNVYVAGYDRYGNLQADFVCAEEEQKVLTHIVPYTLRNELLARVMGNSLEEQVLEDTSYPGVKMAASAVRIDGQCRFIWFFCAVIADELETRELAEDEKMKEMQVLTLKTTLSRFLETIDLIRSIGIERVKTQIFLSQTEEENRRSLYSVNEMALSLKRTEAVTQILQFLDSDKGIEQIMSDFLRITSEYLEVGMSDIFKISEENTDRMDVVTQWCAGNVLPVFDKTLNQPKFPFLEGTKPIILSSESAFLSRFEDENPQMGVKALVAMPVMIGKRTGMYACYFEVGRKRSWKIDELQFLSDAIRILQNIVEKRIQKNSLASSYASLEEILENVGCAIVVIHRESEKILFQNRIMKHAFFDEEIDPQLWSVLTETDAERTTFEFYNRKCGFWYEIHQNSIKWVDGRTANLYAIYDVTDKKKYQRKIEQQAYTDFLTGLYNRMCCERDLAKTVDDAKKYQETGALLYLDLDDFKHINDGLGHQYGDVLLKSISDSMRAIVGIEDTCYRMGGDEFVIIIPPKNYGSFDKIIDSIKEVFAKPWFLKDGEYYCTMSMGIVAFPEDGENVSDLIKKADIAMYEAKKTGKNRVARYNNDHLSISNKRLDMEKNMRDATSSGYEEFEIYYQPIIDIQKDGTPCTGAEALIRWNSAELGFVSPGDFIPLAEYLGLINPIGNYVLKEACKACHFWNKNGHPEYKVNVNLSVIQLLQNNIVDIVADTIKETKLNPRNLTLEVTESLAINDMDRMKIIMSKIRRLGVRIALDDFGTGYSSLNHIREIPLDVIKVDQSFVRDLVEDDYSKSFIKMVAELAGAIGVSICVEGIEKKEQYKVLEGMKVRLIQGFYFGRPMPRDEFEAKYLLK